MSKIIVAGSRHMNDKYRVFKELDNRLLVTDEIVSGDAPGVDTLAIEWAIARNMPYYRFPADWNKYGKAAGPIRNRQMAEYADYLIAFYSGTPGTKNMIQTMGSLGKPIIIIDV